MPEQYWMAPTSQPGMWAIGRGDVEIMWTHDRDVALRAKDALNAGTVTPGNQERKTT